MLKNINCLTIKNIENEVKDIKNELKCNNFKLEKVYAYYSYNDPDYGVKSNIKKENLNIEGLEKIIFEIKKLKENPNVRYLVFGVEYSSHSILAGARDLLTIKKIA